MEHLRNLGNTLIVVEHDEDTMYAADYIVDIGPGAGVEGGEVVAVGTLDEIKANPNSITGQYLSGRRQIPIPPVRRQPQEDTLSICSKPCIPLCLPGCIFAFLYRLRVSDL